MTREPSSLKEHHLHRPPVEMTAHFFPVITVHANEALSSADLASDMEFGYTYEFQVRLAQSEEDELDYQAELSVNAKEKEGCLKGYDIELQVVGLFKVDPSWPTEKREEALRVLCPTMLYNSAREFLLMVTQRGPYPPVYLPTISFHGLGPAPQVAPSNDNPQ